ncbi:MAG: aspartate/glutamate racemase family protein [Promethearchaeota archaeon]
MIKNGSVKTVKRIGILGGISYESTIKYYDSILQKYYENFGDYNYPEIVIFSLNFQKVIEYEISGEKEEYIRYLMSGINALENCGANFIIMSANSVHAVFKELQELSKIPILSIVKPTVEIAKQLKMKKLLLLGIKYTMQSTFYQDYCKKLGIEIITPSNDDQDIIDKIIFDELVIGFFKQESKMKLIQIIEKFNDIDGVILGCTELPLILDQKDTEKLLLDTIDLHVDATFDFYLKL